MQETLLSSSSRPGFEPRWIRTAATLLAETQTRNGVDWACAAESFVRAFTEFVGDPLLSEVTPQKCNDYIVWRLAGGGSKTRKGAIEPKLPSPSTLRKEIAYLSRVFKRAVAAGDLARDPWQDVKRPREPRRAPVFLTREQAAALLGAAPPDRRLRYTLLLYTGARRSEAERLTWGDIDFDARLVRLRNAQKGAGTAFAVRSVPLPQNLAKRLREAGVGLAGANILRGSENNWNRDLAADCRNAGIPPIRPHDLRHTYASWLAQSGQVPLQKIMELMGHADFKTTLQYAHLIPDQHGAALTVLDFWGKFGGKSDETDPEESKCKIYKIDLA